MSIFDEVTKDVQSLAKFIIRSWESDWFGTMWGFNKKDGELIATHTEIDAIKLAIEHLNTEIVCKMNAKVKCNHMNSSKYSNCFIDGEIYDVINGVLYCGVKGDTIPYSIYITYDSIEDINQDMKNLGLDTRFSLVLDS